ncbi:MAG: class I SAM-dependent methyltransferase [Deltaproteobacteria bacterium]|nr:class I SAM-dependent methyltransferase [Deltaproteobacteria bacterium]
MTPPYDRYFDNRSVSPDEYRGYQLPRYLLDALPPGRNARILDIGCGFGQTLEGLGRLGYASVRGVDVSSQAVEACAARGLRVVLIEDLRAFCETSAERFDFVLMSHVLEHLPKAEIVDTLRAIREHLLAVGGALLVMVPNAQSPTGCYWAYEDFTHTTIFTAGSLLFVLRAAGFVEVALLDPDGMADSRPWARCLRRAFLRLYRAGWWAVNAATSSSFHRPSPQVFSFEVKALAR